MRKKKLQDRALIVSVSIKNWSGRKLDRRVTQEVNELHNTRNAGRFNKVLIAKSELLPIQRVGKEIRKLVYTYTLPWGDNGDRLLSVDLYFKFMKLLKPLIDKYKDLSAKFVSEYQNHIDEAKVNLNGLFNPADYPTETELNHKFDVTLSMSPLPEIPDQNDFRLDVDQDEAIASISDTIVGRHDAAVKDIVKRAQDALKGVSAAISRIDNRQEGKRVKFAQSLMDKVEEIANLMPSLNYTGDANVAKLGQAMSEMVEDVEVLKNQPMARSTYQKRVQELNNSFF